MKGRTCLALAASLCGLLSTGIVGCVPGGGTGLPGGSITGGGDSGYCEPVGLPDTTTQQQMLTALNAYRVSSGLSELIYSDTLEEAAQSHARDMYERSFFDHTNPDGDGPLQRAIAAGFCDPRLVGENIAFGYTSVSAVQAGWESSPGHNANMLNTEVVFVGMGHYLAPTGTRYWVQVFGATWH